MSILTGMVLGIGLFGYCVIGYLFVGLDVLGGGVQSKKYTPAGVLLGWPFIIASEYVKEFYKTWFTKGDQ